MKKRLLSLGMVIVVASAARGGIYYDDAAKCIRVVDFPKAYPCTLARLLQMDRLYGWGKVSYDAATDAYAVLGDLFIGNNDGTDTYLQIGSKAHPTETLVMHGTLVVCPFFIKGQHKETLYYRAKPCTNRVTIGVEGDESIKPALKFQPGGPTLILGSYRTADGKLKRGFGGQLCVHYGTITSATDKPFGRKTGAAGMLLVGDRVVLDHATISNVRGAATYGMDYHGRVNDTVFKNVGTAIINGKHDLKRCTFRNCDVAIRDYGCIDAVLTDCTFEGNNANWTLAYSDKGIVCIDCTWEPPRKADLYMCWKNRRTGKMQYPSFVSKRHVVVEVVDEAGKPVPNAQVKVRSEHKSWVLSENTNQTTDNAGRTPGQGNADAILLVEVVKQATDVKNKPKVTECSYSIQANAKGFAPSKVQGFRPTKSWDAVRIVLKKQ